MKMKTTLICLVIVALPPFLYAKNKPSGAHAPAAHAASHPAFHSNPSAHNFSQHTANHAAFSNHSTGMVRSNNFANGHANPLIRHSGFNAANGNANNALLRNHANFANGHQAFNRTFANRAGARHFATNYRIHPYREVFHNYHAAYHDRYWYGSHYDRLAIFGGGYYYWDGGYWYPAWGYDPGVAFYAYDGPIYSYENLPPDQVIVNVQTELQDQGYYNGNIDGQLGPQTREAVGAYQHDHNLEVTSAIDEPTVEALGVNS
jgi:hypothetical protein